MTRPLYITTPIYYVNDRPHIGHAYTTIVADLIARANRLAGREAFFLTGTDEHGSKIAEAAAAAKLPEIEFCNRTVETFLTAWKNLGVANDGFIRTTSPRHREAVRKIALKMKEARTASGEEVIYTGFYEGLYCTGCERFYTEKELVDSKCPFHLTRPNMLREKNYFFRLSAFLPVIKSRIQDGSLTILPEERRREVLGLIEQGVPDFSLSRERVSWGISLPFDESQSAYVWVDALTNYISGIGYGDDPAGFEKWWNGSRVVHLMAKDILKFHCLIWPAMLLAAGIKLPDQIFLHGFFTIDGNKMSKSLGNFIDPNDMVARFGPDATRYLLLTQFQFGLDGDIQASRFVSQYNADLANDLGNLVSRVAKIIETGFDGTLPAPDQSLEGLSELVTQAESAGERFIGHIDEFRVGQAVAESMQLVRVANKFFNDRAPWVLIKAGKTGEAGGVLRACCEVLRIVSVLIHPVIPSKASAIRSFLGCTDATLTLADTTRFWRLTTGQKIALSETLFPRKEETEPVTAPGKHKPSAPSVDITTGVIDITAFSAIDIRVATVLTAERVEGATKLLKLSICIGEETRQIVAGVAEYYMPEAITGKQIVVVANLKPAVIRGIESHGMLLAAKTGKELVLVGPQGPIASGAKVG